MLRISDDSPWTADLYARGYVFRSDGPPVAPAGWRRGTFGGYHLAHDPRLEATRVTTAGCELLALGTLVDVRHPEEATADGLARLARVLATSHDALHAELDHTAGRYVLAYVDVGGEAGLVADATGMKSAFYHVGRPRMVVSHPHLLIENGVEAMRAPIESKFGYPGLRAPLQKSFLLTPNACLDLGTLVPRRVWPRGPVAERSVDAAAETLRANMAGLLRAVRARRLVSVTAGLDSRLTLSFLRDADDVRCFTYYRSDTADTDTADLAFAEALRDDMGCNVEILRPAETPPMPRDFDALLEANTFIRHQRLLAWAYAHRYRDQGLLHLRSNISEVGREFWGTKGFEVRTGRDLARVYLRGKREYRANYVFRVIDLFEEFDRVTGLTGCAGMVDVKSLFYWEFRMASWHAQLVCESDPAFDTLSLFNCRATLEAMLSVPREERAQGTVLRRVIAGNWPELARYPVNGRPFWPEA